MCAGAIEGSVIPSRGSGAIDSHLSHRSEMARTKYCGGSGSKSGVVKLRVCVRVRLRVRLRVRQS